MATDDAQERGLRVTRTLTIPDDELVWRFSASGGPGGQHANTANTRAEVSFDIQSSVALGPIQRTRLLARVGPSIRVAASDTRSQLRNRELAAARLAEQLADALRVERPRTATRPTKASKVRRLESKAKRSHTKAQRRRPAGEE